MNRFISCVAAFGLALCSCSSSSPETTTSPAEESDQKVRDAISQAWREHIDAAKRKDASRIADIYAEDAVFVISGSTEVRGRPALQKMEEQGLAASDVLEAVHSTHHLQLVGQAGFELGSVVGPVRPKGESPRNVVFRYMAMWQQTDGHWLISYLVGASDASSQ